MKRFYNKETKQWYVEKDSLTVYKNGKLFSGIPSEEKLKELGFEEYIEEKPAQVNQEEQERQQRMYEIQEELRQTDYLALKAFEGEDMSDHPDWKERRKALREEYRELELKSK